MGSGFRTFQSGEVLTADNVQNYLMDQAVMVFAGTAARSSALPSPETGMTAYSTATGVQVYNGSAWVNVGGAGIADFSNAATGTYSSGGVDYKYLTFTASSTLTVTRAGLADLLIIGGGGGGGNAAGGGAGGYLTITDAYLAAGSVTVTVGAGGAVEKEGVTSRIGSYYVAGGGSIGYVNDGTLGGSGGGATTAGKTGGAGIPTLGNNGGNGATTAGGGGGGAGGVGSNASTGAGGNGGAGLSSSITGSSVARAGGGGGGGTSSGGTASDGGGAGSVNTGTAGTANTGGGGGGGWNVASGAGGSGIVIVRVRTN
jgi:hypothetical protein